jgi:hypothetical protein
MRADVARDDSGMPCRKHSRGPLTRWNGQHLRSSLGEGPFCSFFGAHVEGSCEWGGSPSAIGLAHRVIIGGANAAQCRCCPFAPPNDAERTFSLPRTILRCRQMSKTPAARIAARTSSCVTRARRSAASRRGPLRGDPDELHAWCFAKKVARGRR